MGLDMYLTGDRFFTEFEGDKPEKPRAKRDGFEIEAERLKLAYWRKFADLHGFIVETFADGVDECQTIELDVADMRQIITALKEQKLPHTEGFFFRYEADGAHWESVRKGAIKDFERVIAWLEAKEDYVWKSVEYRASW